jgi:hypothetical protein
MKPRGVGGLVYQASSPAPLVVLALAIVEAIETVNELGEHLAAVVGILSGVVEDLCEVLHSKLGLLGPVAPAVVPFHPLVTPSHAGAYLERGASNFSRRRPRSLVVRVLWLALSEGRGAVATGIARPANKLTQDVVGSDAPGAPRHNPSDAAALEPVLDSPRRIGPLALEGFVILVIAPSHWGPPRSPYSIARDAIYGVFIEGDGGSGY